MPKLKTGTAVTLLLLGCGIASGKEPGYSFLELDHENIHVDVEEGSEHYLDSFGLAASWQVVNHLALVAEGRRVKENSTAFTTYEAFGNYKAGLTTFWSIFGLMDFYATANYDFSVKDYGGELGFRARPKDFLELHAALNVDGFPRNSHRRTGSGDVEIGLAVYVTRSLALGYDYRNTIVGDDPGTINRLYIRYDFSPDSR